MATAVISAQPDKLGFGYYLHALITEIRYEFLRMLRLRAFSLSTIGFPVMFYLLFGVANHNPEAARYLLASFSCFGMIGAALFALGAGVAMERMQGWLELKQASPMPRFAYLVAKTVSCSAFALITVLLLLAIGMAFGGVHVTLAEAAKLIATTLAGAIPFASLGLLLSFLMPPTAGPGLINLVYLPMSFASGLWMPINTLPHWMQRFAPALPAYHYAQLALNIFGYAQAGSSMTLHWEALIGFTCLMLGAVWLIFTRGEAKA